MSVLYKEILASILKKKFVEDLKPAYIDAFQYLDKGSLTLAEKHRLLYAIAKTYTPSPQSSNPLSELDTVINALKSLQQLANIELIEEDRPTRFCETPPTLNDVSAYKVAMEKKELVETTEYNLFARIERMYTTLGIPCKNPSKANTKESSDVPSTTPFLPSGGAAAVATQNAFGSAAADPAASAGPAASTSATATSHSIK